MAVHPYYPVNANIQNYVTNESSLIQLLMSFGALVLLVVVAAYFSASQSTRHLRSIDQFAAPWFALCGFLHVVFEGYYIIHQQDVPAMQTLFGQLWKEYSLSDSRYLISDVFTVCVETITVFVWGPLSWLTLVAILKNSPSRHTLQVVLCTAHLYGVALYYATNWAEYRFKGVSYSRPEFLYFWVYYVGFNLPWAIVPLALLADSWNQIAKAFGAIEDIQSRAKTK